MSGIEVAIERLNGLSTSHAASEMERFCGAAAWCYSMAERRPFQDRQAMKAAAEASFDAMTQADWLEAFSHHPKIGDIQSLRMKFAGNRDWSAGEQAGVAVTGDDVMVRLADGNAAYERTFGFIFIVCATGKSAEEMLAMLQQRLSNEREKEIEIASREQRKITQLRIDKWETPP